MDGAPPTTFVPAAGSLFDTEPIQSLGLFRYAAPSGVVSLQPVFDLPQLKRRSDPSGSSPGC